MLAKAYAQFEEQTGYLTEARLSKADRIRNAVLHWDGPVTKRAVMERYPDIARVTVERTLTAMVREGQLRKTGGGPATAYLPR